MTEHPKAADVVTVLAEMVRLAERVFDPSLLSDEGQALFAAKSALAASPVQPSHAGGGIHPTIYDAMVRSHVSLFTRNLITAAQVLADACVEADCREELPEEVDGSLIDAVNEAIAALRTNPEGVGVDGRTD